MFGFCSFVSFENKQQLGTVAATHSNTPNIGTMLQTLKALLLLVNDMCQDTSDPRDFGTIRLVLHSPAYFLAGRTEERFNVTRYY